MNRTHIAGKMNNRLTILIVAFFLGVPAFGAGAAGRQVLLRDGFPLTGVEGKLIAVEPEDQSQYIKFEEDDVWLFRLESDVNDYRVVVKGPVSLQLLPSTALEKIIADAKEHPDGTYRLWGRITKYKGANYIFGEFFLPVVEMAPVEFDEPSEVAEANEPGVVEVDPVAEPNMVAEGKIGAEPNEPVSREDEAPKPAATKKIAVPKLLRDPNGILEIPQEVLDKLNSKKIIVPRKMKPRVKAVPDKLETRKIDLPGKIKPEPKPQDEPKKNVVPAEKAKVEEKPEDKPEPAERPAMKLDSVLADRTATLLKQDNGRCRFVLDALGLSVQELSLQALPNEVLELTEARQIAELNPVRFKIAGIKTEFKGKQYLLLQKATRVYGHGNFGN